MLKKRNLAKISVMIKTPLILWEETKCLHIQLLLTQLEFSFTFGCSSHGMISYLYFHRPLRRFESELGICSHARANGYRVCRLQRCEADRTSTSATMRLWSFPGRNHLGTQNCTTCALSRTLRDTLRPTNPVIKTMTCQRFLPYSTQGMYCIISES